jgi:MraZ protein
MANFIGDHSCKLDAKGRLLMPSAVKKQMDPGEDEKFVVKKDIYEKCLVLFPMKEWENQNRIIRERTNPYNKEHNRFLREFFKGTAEVSLDGNNRLLIPKRLLELIHADRELVLAGQDEKIEIWPKEEYDRIGEDSKAHADLAEKILGGDNQNGE